MSEDMFEFLMKNSDLIIKIGAAWLVLHNIFKWLKGKIKKLSDIDIIKSSLASITLELAEIRAVQQAEKENNSKWTEVTMRARIEEHHQLYCEELCYCLPHVKFALKQLYKTYRDKGYNSVSGEFEKDIDALPETRESGLKLRQQKMKERIGINYEN